MSVLVDSGRRRRRQLITAGHVLRRAAKIEVPWVGKAKRIDDRPPWWAEERFVKGRYGRRGRRLRVEVQTYSGDPVDRWFWSVKVGIDSVANGFASAPEIAWALAEAEVRLFLARRELERRDG